MLTHEKNHLLDVLNQQKGRYIPHFACVISYTYFLLLPFWNTNSIKIWVGLILSALDLSQLKTQVSVALRVSADLLRWCLITWKLSEILLTFQNGNFVFINTIGNKHEVISVDTITQTMIKISTKPFLLCASVWGTRSVQQIYKPVLGNSG